MNQKSDKKIDHLEQIKRYRVALERMAMHDGISYRLLSAAEYVRLAKQALEDKP